MESWRQWQKISHLMSQWNGEAIAILFLENISRSGGN